MFFTHFTNKNHPPGFYISGVLAWSGLKFRYVIRKFCKTFSLEVLFMNCFKICQDNWFVWSIFTNCFVMTVCSCHVTYAFQGEFTPYSWLNVKELFAWSTREIWTLSDCYWTRTQNHLVRRAVWPNGWMFVYEVSGSGFESSCFSML